MLKNKGLFIWLVICAFLVSSGPQKNLNLVYLTYTEDPATSMTVQWFSSSAQNESTVFFRKQGSQTWLQSKGASVRPGYFDVLVHRVDLSSLTENSYYEFRVGESKDVYLFSTLPKQLSKRPLRFVVGGDAYRDLSSFRKMNKQIAKKNPDFVVLGGDIAYTYSSKTVFKGKDWEMKRWMTFFSEWKNSMVGDKGRLIPILVVVGNHDVPPKMVDPRTTPVLLYQLFAFKKENVSYRAVDVGSYLSLVLLDSEHSYPIEGEQTSWLKEALLERKAVPYKFAVYHVGAYPSVYAYNGITPKKIREFWCPVFEENGVQVAFENHSHAFKRTFPIKNEKIDPSGIIYMGDGCWGVSPRKPTSNAWYLEKRIQKNCFSLVMLAPAGCDIVSYSNTGDVIDTAPHFAAK